MPLAYLAHPAHLMFSSDSLLKALYESLPHAVLVVDADRNIVAANAAAQTLFGYAEQELTAMRPGQLHAEKAESRDIGEALFPLGTDSGTLHRQVEFRRKDGSMFPAELTVSHIQAESGAPVGLVAMIRDLTDVLAAQAEQLGIERILEAALESVSEGFVVYDQDDRLVLCNDAYRQIYSVSAPAMQKGRTFESILRYGLDHGQYPEAGKTSVEREKWLEDRLRHHDIPSTPLLQQVGADRWIQVEERITADNYRVGLRTDVSALLRAKSEAERLGTMLEGVAQEVYLVNLKDGRILSANRSALENLQYTLEEIRELTPRDINADHSVFDLADKIAPIIAGSAKVLTIDTEHMRKDGTTYACRVRVERLETESEPVVMAFAEDITERLAIERSLERKQHEFETLVANLPDFITRSRPDTTLTYVNDHYARFIGRNVEEMVGHKFIDFTPEPVRAGMMDHFASLTHEAPIKTMEQEMVRIDGVRRWYLWSNLMVFDDGAPVELVSVGRDITESREARERIAAQSRELSMRNDALEQFGGVVSHDLKAPLRQIQLFADMIAEDVEAGKTDDLELFSTHVSERARLLQRMITSLFEYSQLAYQEISRKHFEVTSAITAAWDNLSVNVIESGGRLKDETNAIAHADFDLMTQLLQNLFANSLKYRQDSQAPEIRVMSEYADGVVSIVVEDNGIGIDPVYAENIFGVFQRLHRDESTYAGSGIGLSLCRRIAESHGGSIGLDPEFRDGARFVVQLPFGRD